MPVIIYLGAEHGAAKQEILSLNWFDIGFEFKGSHLSGDHVIRKQDQLAEHYRDGLSN